MADKSLFNRLKRLFSTNVVIRNVQGRQLKVTDTERIQSYSDLNTNFLKSRGLAGFHSTVGRYGYNELATISMQRLVLFRDYDLMESDPIIACLAEDTKVSTLKGFFTIKELSEMYPTDENFEIWSWDREECKYTIGQAHHPRKTGTKKIIKLVLDNGNFLKCTEDHRIMLIDGTYKEAGKLEIDDRIMPFYYKNKEYMMISDRHGKYKKAHRYIYEDVLNINVNGKHIHHINHNKYDNTISNLIDILPEDHMKYHELSDITSSKKEKSWNKEMRKNASNKMKKLWNIDEYKKLFLSGFKEFQTRYDYKELMSNYMKDRWKNSDKIEKNEMLKGFKDWQNSDEGKKFMSDHTSKLNKKRWKTDIKYIKKMAKLSSDRMKNLWKNKEWAEYKRKLHSETIKLKYANNPEYVNMIKRIDTNNGRFNSDITNEYILSEAYKYKTLSEFSNTLNLSCKNKNQFVNRRLKSLGYNSFNDYKSKYVYQNHKIVNIIDENEIVDVYDLTVDFYENFALECGIIVSNSALDVYADESSVKNEFGDVLTIKSDDDKIKDVLHNLFYDILNIEFNLWPWIRTLCKYGDMFLKLEISEKYGIVNVIPVSPYEMTREEGFDPQNPFRVKFKHEGLLSGQLEYENYEIAHFRLVNDHNFLPYGKCLSQNTHIDTEYGSKFISDIKKGDKVWTFNIENRKFELSEVLNSVCSGKKDILRISTPHNFIDASYDHPVLVYDNNEFKYIKAHDIKMDQLLVISTGKMKFNRDIVINKKYIQSLDGPKVDLSPLECVPDIVDNEFAEFCGFMLGDGWLCKYQYNYGINISLGVDEYLNDRYISILEKYSGKKCNIQKFKGKSRTATIYSKLLHTILNNMGISGNAHTKRIPEWVFELSNDKKMSFIIGLTNADGSSFTDKWATRYGIWLCNKKLIFDFKKLIQTLNIKSSIPTHKYNNTEIEICGEKCNSTETHHFNYYLEGKEKTQIKKYNILNLDDDSNFILEPVRKIERMKNEKTYDIQVNTKNSNFIANGIIVHNSMVESARRVWKQLWLMQDAMLIHRIMRAPEKRIFKIDTGNIAPNETEQYIKNVVNKIKKVPYVDPRTGEYNLKYNMMNMTEDFFIPVRGGDSGTNIESLPGLEYNAIEDIEYLKNMMMAALKIPKAFLGYDEGISGKATLASEDVRFARTIERIQKIFISELSKIAVIHLYSQGFKNEDIVNFELSLTNPSTIYEQEKISLWQEKVSLIRDMKEIRMLSDEWIYENVLNLSNDEREKQKKLVLDDVKREFRYEQITAEGNDPFVTHQTFGTPHDLIALQKGRTSESDKNIDFGQTNFKMNWDDSTGKEDNITDSKDYDKNYNDTKRQKPASKYKQDSHIRGRDPIGSDEYHNSVNTTNKRKSGSVFDGINKTQLNNMLTEMSKNKNIILESLKIDNESCENDENENSDDNTYLNENNLLK